jgi:hypothetical protein
MWPGAGWRVERDPCRARHHAIVEFSHAYAKQNERDYKALVNAVASGEITAEKGL